MAVNQDRYLLGWSGNGHISGQTDSIRMDLSLDTNPFLHSGIAAGNVRDSSGRPIPDAVVIIMDENATAVAHTVTRADGSFLCFPLEPGCHYRACAKAPGYDLSESVSFHLLPDETRDIDFFLVPDPMRKKSLLTGEVRNYAGLPLYSALVELHRVTEVGNDLVCLSLTNEIGSFCFHEMDPGSYRIKAAASGYFCFFSDPFLAEAGRIAYLEVVLKEDPSASKGMVLGLITDTYEQPIAGADVILYRVSSDQTRTPVSYTRTNQDGIYLFVNLPGGDYSINSNRTIRVE